MKGFVSILGAPTVQASYSINRKKVLAGLLNMPITDGIKCIQS